MFENIVGRDDVSKTDEDSSSKIVYINESRESPAGSGDSIMSSITEKISKPHSILQLN